MALCRMSRKIDDMHKLVCITRVDISKVVFRHNAAKRRFALMWWPAYAGIVRNKVRQSYISRTVWLYITKFHMGNDRWRLQPTLVKSLLSSCHLHLCGYGFAMNFTSSPNSRWDLTQNFFCHQWTPLRGLYVPFETHYTFKPQLKQDLINWPWYADFYILLWSFFQISRSKSIFLLTILKPFRNQFQNARHLTFSL